MLGLGVGVRIAPDDQVDQHGQQLDGSLGGQVEPPAFVGGVGPALDDPGFGEPIQAVLEDVGRDPLVFVHGFWPQFTTFLYMIIPLFLLTLIPLLALRAVFERHDTCGEI